MNGMSTPQYLRRTLADLFGLGLKDFVGVGERVGHVRATATIGIAVGLPFSLFNILTPGLLPLGLTEFAAVAFLLVPAAALAVMSVFVAVAETLILLSGVVIFGALVVFGGVEGTGLFWVFAFPFMAFFLKGQMRGWWISLGFLLLVASYLLLPGSRPDFAYRYTADYATHFTLSLFFYTLVASAFNLLRSRFEQKLQARVLEKTAAAKAYLGQLEFLATHDTLTGLPNRVGLMDILGGEIAEATAAGQGLVICNLRLERLFELGNVLGLPGADNIVRHVAERLEQAAFGKALLARTRRDEFVMIYRLENDYASPEELLSLIGERHFSVQEQGYSLHAELTLGLSICPAHSTDPQLLLKKAEQAMLQARKSDRGWSVYDEALDLVFVRHHLLFGKLREALQMLHLEVHYQPQVNLASGRVIGAEALTRWNDPAEGPIEPTVFIPVAEESGLIRPLTDWVVRVAMFECARWQTLGLDLDVSINLSARSLLDPQLLDSLMDAASDACLPHRRVNLEITESCFMTSPERALEVMRRISAAGFRLSIDDFGTGFSSLSYLKNMPVDEIKIDQSFVLTLLESQGDQAIVSSTTDLAHSFGLSVVAEGIEDEATAGWLRAHACDIGQGYRFARAMPANDFVCFAQARQAGALLEGRA